MPVPVQTKLPRVEPILATARPQPFNHPAWLFEPKYDGFRGLLYLTRRGCTFYSKRGNGMTRFQELAEQIRAELPRREVIFDGEIVAIDDEGRIDFWGLMRGRGTLAYAAFDVLWLNGRDLRGLPRTQRKKRLERLIPAAAGALNRVPCYRHAMAQWSTDAGTDLPMIQAQLGHATVQMTGRYAKRRLRAQHAKIMGDLLSVPQSVTQRVARAAGRSGRGR